MEGSPPQRAPVTVTEAALICARHFRQPKNSASRVSQGLDETDGSSLFGHKAYRELSRWGRRDASGSSGQIDGEANTLAGGYPNVVKDDSSNDPLIVSGGASTANFLVR